jgi:NAD(P)-dependent dehydrogenase (short-subunit alcohol dehydrogenase family)
LWAASAGLQPDELPQGDDLSELSNCGTPALVFTLASDPMPTLRDKIALIAGGTSGIGLATAKAFLAHGAKVIVGGRDRHRGEAAEKQLRDLGDAIFHVCDVTNPMSVADCVAVAVKHYGGLSCAVNSAACDFPANTTHETSNDEASHTLSTDVLGVFNCMKYEIEAMLRYGEGTIVNVSSVTGLSGTPTAAMYSAGKHAIIGLTRSAALEYIARGIRINAVCPGPTDTPRRDRRAVGQSEDEMQESNERLARAIPIGRIARPEEIANAILWLCSPESSYVVGHSLVIDGGLHA